MATQTQGKREKVRADYTEAGPVMIRRPDGTMVKQRAYTPAEHAAILKPCRR
jgi:hypothetical protein